MTRIVGLGISNQGKIEPVESRDKKASNEAILAHLQRSKVSPEEINTLKDYYWNRTYGKDETVKKIMELVKQSSGEVSPRKAADKKVRFAPAAILNTYEDKGYSKIKRNAMNRLDDKKVDNLVKREAKKASAEAIRKRMQGGKS